MKSIQENPYRLVGLLSNATAKEVQRRKGQITAFVRVGREVSSDFDFVFLDPISRDEISIAKAFSAIQQARDVVNHSLFWFSKTNSFDDTALNYLINGDKEKAIDIWEKVTYEKEITPKSVSCFNNIGTLKLIGNNPSEINQGIKIKLVLIESSSFKDFVVSVAGDALVVEKQKQVDFFVNAIIKGFETEFSNNEILKLFEGCDEKHRKLVIDRFSESPIYFIESAIDSAKNKRNQSKNNAYKYGKELFDQTRPKLKELENFLGVEDLKYKLIADNLAKEIMQCGIDYFNESQENESSENYLDNAMQLNKLADGIAVGKLTKEKVKDNIATLEEMKDRALTRAIEVLTFIRDAFEKNQIEISEQVKKQALNLQFGQTINWTKVNAMINDSLDWDKVIKLVRESIPPDNMDKIKNSKNQERLKKYRGLVEFLQSKLGYSKAIQVSYLNFWETATRTASNRPVGPSKGPSSSGDAGTPEWLKFVGVIAVILIIAGAIWGWDGVLGVIVIGALIVINGFK